MSDSVVLEGIDSSLPTPLYHQVYLVLKKKIMDGDFPYDTVLPGEKDLCKSLGVSRITVTRALTELANDGYVARFRGRGTVVRHRVQSPVVRADFDGLLENLMEMGVKTQIELLRVETVKPSRAVAEALECSEDDTCQFAIRRRLIENEPFSYLHTYIPDDIASSFSPEDLEKKPILQLLTEAGSPPHRARQIITAVEAEGEVAAALDLPAGAAVLRITRIIKTKDGRPIEYIIAYYRPDRYEYEMKLNKLKTTHSGY